MHSHKVDRLPRGNRVTAWIPTILRWTAALIILGVGIHYLDFNLRKTAIFGLVLFAIPTLGQLFKSPAVRVYSLWLGAFVLLQTVAGPLLLGHRFDYITLPPHLDDTLIADPGALPGVVGIQHITTDEKGFRVSPRIDYAHKTGLRIFAIGGSTTENLPIDDRQTWTHLLQQMLQRTLGRPVSVINTGVSGLRARFHIATLQEILRYQPDMVLFLVGANDWAHDIRYHFGSRAIENQTRPRFDNSPLGRIVQALGTVVLHNGVPTHRVLHIGTPPPGFFYTGLLLHANSLRRTTRYEYFPTTISTEYAQNLATISRICKKHRTTCVFITQPNAYKPNVEPELKNHFWLTPADENFTVSVESMAAIAKLYNNALIAFARQHGHPVCDIDPKVAPSFANFFDDAHYNTSGSHTVAELVTACVAPLLQKHA